MANSYLTAGFAIALCSSAGYFAGRRGALPVPPETHPRGAVRQAEALRTGVNGAREAGMTERSDDDPSELVALRRALLAQAMSAPLPAAPENPIDQARKTLDERMMTLPPSLQESARMERVLRSVVDSGALGDTVATVACAATMCKVDLADSDDARVGAASLSLLRGISKAFASSVIYPQGTGELAVYLSSNSEDLRPSPP